VWFYFPISPETFGLFYSSENIPRRRGFQSFLLSGGSLARVARPVYAARARYERVFSSPIEEVTNYPMNRDERQPGVILGGCIGGKRSRPQRRAAVARAHREMCTGANQMTPGNICVRAERIRAESKPPQTDPPSLL
jgi:hypothetical protein